MDEPESTRETVVRNRCGSTRKLPMVLAAAAISAMAATSAGAQVLNFRQYTATEGLPQTQVLALHQDAGGYLWIGTYGGLSRYNGHEFRTYTAADGLAANSITAIAEDRAGRLHVGSIGGGVCTLDAGVIRCLRASDGLPHDDVHDVFVDSDGTTIWVATFQGVARIGAGSVQSFGTADGVPGLLVNRILRDRHGELWVAAEGGLARFDGVRFVPVHQQVLSGEVVAMLLDTRWGLLVGAGNRLFLLRDGALRPVPLPPLPTGALVTDGAVDANGDVMIATRAGVLHYDGTTFRRYSTRNGLLFDQVNRVAVDREGNFWFGTDRGLSRLTPGPFRHYTVSEGLPNPFVRAIHADAGGRLWLGTRDGVGIREADTIRVLPLGTELSDHRVFSLAGLADGGMLIGTRGGLVHHDGSRVRRVYGIADGLPGVVVPALLADDAGGVWIGTDRGLARWSEGEVRQVTGHPELDETFVVALARDAHGRLWVGGRSGGVYVYDGTRVTTIGPAQGMTWQGIWAIARDPQGVMWIGSNGDGVYRVNGDDLTDIDRLTMDDGLIDNFIWQVQPDGRGGMWLYTNRGLDRVTGATIQHYGRGRGLLELEGSASASWLDDNGDLWFGTSNGLVRYSPHLDVPGPRRPPVHVEALISGADTLPLHDARIRAGHGVVKIRFASPTFRDEGGVRFRYRLLGTGTAWSEATTERSIGYAGLGPGNYEFQVSAIDADGETSEVPASLAFTVTPLFWQTWWFRALAAALIVAVVGMAVLLRTRTLRAEQRRLEAEVAMRTRELSLKNTDLEHEVAERQHAEDALRSNQQRMREVIEYSTNMFYSHSPDGELTYVSPQSQRLLGCSPEEALRCRYTDFLTDHPANTVAQQLTQQALDSGAKVPPYELELRGRDGVTRWVEVNEAPVLRDGTIIGIVGSLTDITDARRAADQQERLESQLRQAQKMEAVGRLAGGIAHDFNNLLTAVVGNTDLVSAGLDPDHPLQDELTQVTNAADRAASLVHQLLAFSRQQLIRRSVLELNEVITESSRMLGRMIGSDIEVRLELAAGPLCIEADRAQLDQVLINLSLNARDAMQSGGTLTIATAALELTQAGVDGLPEAVPAGPYAALRVTDTGVGMDEETMRHVFEPFFTTKAVGKGTGLGLATVYGIVTQNGGGVRIESRTGVGTTFHILLPRVPPPDAAATPGAAAAEHDPAALPGATSVPAEIRSADAGDATTNGARTILVVEDDDAVRQLVRRSLERSGFRVLEASDGREALALCAGHSGTIDLLLTDMVMPGLNGRDVARRVNGLRPGTPVLYMSGHTRDALGSRFMLDEDTQVLQKPFAPADLVQHVWTVLNSVGAQA